MMVLPSGMLEGLGPRGAPSRIINRLGFAKQFDH
jgi:hypothetical protein